MGILDEVLSTPFIYWSHVVGLFMATAILVSSGFFMVGVAFKSFKTVALRGTYKKFSNVLYQVAVRNDATNPDISALARLLLVELDPNSTLLDADMAEVRKRLNLQSIEDMKAEAMADGSPTK